MITQLELQNFLDDLGLTAATFFTDSEYSLPARSWVTGEFGAALKEEIERLQLTYFAESWDCDDFSRFSATLVGICNARTQNGKSIAFGEFWYQPESVSNSHSINAFVVREFGKLKLCFFEPQTQKEVTLTDGEILSCFAYRF